MPTTNSHSNDPRPQTTPPSEPNTPDQHHAEHTRTQQTLAWATVGLSAAFWTAGVVLSLMGHEAVGAALVTAYSSGGGVSARK